MNTKVLNWKTILTILALLFLAGSVSPASTILAQSGNTTRVSEASDGTQGSNNSQYPSISADGRYVAFESYATNLVNGDTNITWDIFAHDRQTGLTSRVSVASDGTQGNGESHWPSISADGRYVVFESSSSNLVTADTNGTCDIFVHDLQTKQTTRVSVASNGTQSNGETAYCYWSSISNDNRYVAFSSSANNLVSGDTNSTKDVFVHNLQSGETTRVSVSSDGTQGNDNSYRPFLSVDGRYVVFESYSSSLVSGDTNGIQDIFIHDRQTGQTNRLSIASDGTQGNGDSIASSIRPDGRYVAFQSSSTNLVSGDTNGVIDIFVHDLQSGKTTRVSVSSDGTQSNNFSLHPSLSSDGRYVAFESSAENLADDDNNGSSDVFVHNSQSSQTTRISLASDGTQANGTGSHWTSISADGRYVAFDSTASNLVSGDTNGMSDIFVREIVATPSTPWTLMFYLDGDNNLDASYVAAFNQLEAAANNPNVNVVVAWDRLANGNSAYYKVQYDTDLDETNPAAGYTDNVNRWPKGELQMNNPVTLSDFVVWARTNYPAQHHALVISNHGTGLNGLATDNGSGGDWLSVNEWSSALATVTNNGANKIDVVFADACLMGMIEDAYQIRNYASYYVASENLLWIPAKSTSGPYDNYVASIGAATSARDFAVALVNKYKVWLDADYSSAGYTISAVDLTQLGNLVTANNTLASQLNSQMSTYGSQVSGARADTQVFDSNNSKTLTTADVYVDLYSFAGQVKAHVANAAIQTAADNVMAAVQNYVIAEAHKNGILKNNGAIQSFNDSHGVSIFFPANASSFYNSANYDFAVGATWPGTQSIGVQDNEVEWGPMLVTYFNVTQPGGTDTPQPPPLVSPLNPEESGIYLPVILKNK